MTVKQTKVFALTVLAAACSASVAQESSLTVYGTLDGGVSRVTGIKGGTRNDVISGIMDGSRLGFRGNEDIGGGYRALFTLEHRLELDTGDIKNRPYSGTQVPDRFVKVDLLGLSTLISQVTAALTAAGAANPGATANAVVSGAANSATQGIANSAFGVNLGGKFWDRQAYLGLVTPYGAFLAGRQYTPAFEVIAGYDTLGTQSALSAGQVGTFPAAVDLRFDNTVAYRIQLGGVSAVAMAAPSERSTANGHFVGGNVMYRTDAWSVGLGYNSKENELGQKSLTSSALGGWARLGPGTAYALLVQVQDDHPSALSTVGSTLTAGLTSSVGATLAGVVGSGVANAIINAAKQDASISHVGYKYTLGPNVVYVAYTKLNDKLHDADTASYGVTYSYQFSKRTGINASAVRFNNSGTGQVAPGQAGFLGGVTEKAATDSTALALGLRHSF